MFAIWAKQYSRDEAKFRKYDRVDAKDGGSGEMNGKRVDGDG